MSRSLTRYLPILLLLALMSSPFAWGQNNGRISGKVADDQGGVIPGTTVQIVSKDGSVKREVKSDDSGAYSVTGLPPGTYNVIVVVSGFNNFTSPDIDLKAGGSATQDTSLVVAASKEVVDVNTSGGTTTVELESATLATTLSTKEVTGLGLNGRNFSQLIGLSPGVSNQTGQDEAKVGVAGSAKYSVNGGRVEYNTFEVDGSDVLNTSINASRGQSEPLIVYPSIDAVQEIKVLTSDFSALYGKTASGSVLVTTKSGTEKYHGNAYYFIRNELFNARNYFDAPGRTPLYRRQDAGGTIGGPLFIPKIYEAGKTKTFFFFSEELRLEKTPTPYNQAVPTAAERTGDFSDVCPFPVPGIASDTVNLSVYPDCPHAGQESGQPIARPVVSVGYPSAAILGTGLIPQPNSVTGCNTTNGTGLPRCYIASISPSTYWREELFRIDHKLSATQQISFRYVHDSWNTTTLTPEWGVVQNSFPTVENDLRGPGINMEVSLASSFPHSVANRASFSYTSEHITLAPKNGVGLNTLQRPDILNDGALAPGFTSVPGTGCGTAPGSNNTTLTSCALGYIFNDGTSAAFNGGRTPGIVFQGSNGAYGGHGFAADTDFAPYEQTNPTYNLRDDASKTFGRHNLQFGFDATAVQQNEVSAVSGANSGSLQGLLTFSNQQSRFSSGNAFADFLAGPNLSSSGGLNSAAIKSYTQDSGRAKYYNRYKAIDIYLQDDWRVNSKLSLNIGFRASLLGQWYNDKNTAYNWRPEAYNASIGNSVYVDPNFGYVANKLDSSPVPLDPNGSVITNGLVQCGVNGVSKSCMKGGIFFPGPRAGLSYDPFGDGKTAIHAGYGLFWEHGTGFEANVGSLIGSAPRILSETQSNIGNPNPASPSGVNTYNTLGFSCQGGSLQCGSEVLPLAKGSTATFPLNVTSLPTNTVYSYTQQWSLSVQREVAKNVVGQIAYVGTKGTHLTAVRDLNQLQPLSSAQNPFLPGQPLTASVCQGGALYNYFPTSGINGAAFSGGQVIPSSPGIGARSPGYNNIVVACTGNPGFSLSTGQPLGLTADSQRQYPGLSNVISVSNIADSQYHAFQGTLRATTGPLTFGFAYTFSHSIDDASDRSSANFADSLNIHSNRASSDFDQRQLLNVSYLYDLPLLNLLHGFTHLVGGSLEDPEASTAQDSKTLQPLDNDEFGPMLNTLLGGWQLSGITSFQSGSPFSVINAGAPDGTGATDNAGVGDGLGIGSYPDVVGNAKGTKPTVASGQNIGPLLLNPRAFAAPRGLTFGNAGRNYLNNPSRTNFNASLLKHFKPFGEGKEIEFRVEAFNVFNHTQFRIYDPTHPGNTGNNIVNCYGDQSTGYSAGSPSCLAGNSFLHPVDAHDPRILQFGLKASF